MLVVDVLHNTEGLDELHENPLRKPKDELFASLHRPRLRAGQVHKPMHKVEGYVRGLRLSGDDDLAELLEESAWWSLRLHEPTHVVLHLTVGEANALLLELWQALVRGKQLRMIGENIAQGHVVILNLLARSVPSEVSRMLLVNSRQQQGELHDVVNRHHHQHAERALLTVLLRRAVYEKAGVNKQLCDGLPVHVFVEGLALPDLVHVSLRVCPSWVVVAPRLPGLVHAVAEQLSAVNVQPHDPVDSEHRADRSLVLVVGRAARGAQILGVVGVGEAVETELGEGGGDVLEVVLATIVGVSDARSSVARPLPLRGLPPHEHLEQRDRAVVLRNDRRHRLRMGDLLLQHVYLGQYPHHAHAVGAAVILPVRDRGLRVCRRL
mmetsp:Transcript_51540/g.148685  ORF Transcript_51540/g.148685 Transcript_51540/m.148685 type:complete len:380 (+) Transcript_51540:969-2108(+)